MRRILPLLALAAALAGAVPAQAYSPPSAQVAWLPAANDGDVEKAFARGRDERKPLLVYWGAAWCPPCNQLKATLFNRQDFIERARAFVPVYIDGDLPGAQKLGARFKVRGYPTLILFAPDGREITRLPGEADAPQVISLLELGMSSGRPAKAVLADARAGKPLSANEWRLLAFYSWATDEQQLVPAAERPLLLAGLAAAAPDRQIADRLWLKALAESDEGKGVAPDAALRDRVHRVLGDAGETRALMDVLVNEAPEIVHALSGAEERAAWVAAFDTALKKLQADATLSRADRASALLERIELARIDTPEDAIAPKIPAPMLVELREQVARDDREIADVHERQAVITTDAYLLSRAGLWAESDALLKENLAKSHSPYYLMSQLGSNAKKRGDTVSALRWYEQAFERSEGPATRLQWGAAYLSALVELAPTDAVRIERTASRLIAEAAHDPGAFYERSARSLQRVATRLNTWNAGGAHAAVLQRLRAQLDGVCAKLDRADAQRATCEDLFKAAKAG